MKIPLIAQAPASSTVQRAELYRQNLQKGLYTGRRSGLQAYLLQWASFLNQALPAKNEQGQTVQARGRDSDLTPADKLLLLGVNAAGFVQWMQRWQQQLAILNPDAVLPLLPPKGFQFLEDAATGDPNAVTGGGGAGWVYWQQASIDDSNVTWSIVLPSANGVTVAQEAGITIPAVLQPAS